MNIDNLLGNKKTTVSFEFFPPKEESQEQILFNTVNTLKGLNPDFVSITYGAGGSTKDKTVDWTVKLANDYKFNTMMHLTCYGSSSEDIIRILQQLKKAGINNILALRGDPPKESSVEFKDFKYASDLVSFIRSNTEQAFISVAGYPEGHISSTDIEKDIEYTKIKVESGANAIITQLFFDNRHFFDYLEKLEKANVKVPVIAGIMPIISASQAIRFTNSCGVTIPKTLINKIEGVDEKDCAKVGIEHAIKQCEELIKNNVSGIHFYTLNRYNATKEILSGLTIR